MTTDTENENGPSQKRIIVSAVILAIIVVGALWFTFMRTKAPKVSTNSSPLPAIVSPTPLLSSPTKISLKPQTTTLPLVLGKTTATPQAVSPTSRTGSEDWIMPISVLAISAGIAIYPLLLRTKNN